jgi:dihydroorotase
MPNLSPVPDSLDNLKQETDIIDRDAEVKVYPYGSVTKGEQEGSSRTWRSSQLKL